MFSSLARSVNFSGSRSVEAKADRCFHRSKFIDIMILISLYDSEDRQRSERSLCNTDHLAPNEKTAANRISSLVLGSGAPYKSSDSKWSNVTRHSTSPALRY